MGGEELTLCINLFPVSDEVHIAPCSPLLITHHARRESEGGYCLPDCGFAAAKAARLLDVEQSELNVKLNSVPLNQPRWVL